MIINKQWYIKAEFTLIEVNSKNAVVTTCNVLNKTTLQTKLMMQSNLLVILPFKIKSSNQYSVEPICLYVV